MHDLIERHIHVRRRFGLPFANLRIFDRFERNPEQASPLILKRVKLPKRPMGLYESTVMDTVERKITWYYIALTIGLPLTAYGAWHQFSAVEDSLGGTSNPPRMYPRRTEPVTERQRRCRRRTMSRPECRREKVIT